MATFDLAASTSVFLVIALATFGLGAPAARLVKLRDAGREQLVWEAALGFLAATLLLTLVGLLGWLDRRAIVAATVVAAVGGVIRLRRILSTTCSADRDEGRPPPTLPTYALLIAAGVAAAAAFGSSAAPPTAGDALCYHLDLPKRFLQQGRIDFRPDDDNITYPLLAEMGFLWALAFGTPAAAAAIQWGCGLLLAGAAYLTGLPYLGRQWSWIAAAVVLLVPGVNNQMTAPLNDVACAAYCALALAAWDRARRNGRAGDFAAVGVMLGGAVGVKYTALVIAASLAVVWSVAAIEDVGRRRTLLRGAACAMVIATLVGGLWYARAAWHRGDPLYPFLSAVAGAGAPHAFPESKTPFGRGPTAIVAAPWALTMEPERFGGRAHQLGPLFLMFVPAALALGTCRAFGGLPAVAGIYFVGCVVLRQNVRFLLPVVPIAAVIVVSAWRAMAAWPRGARLAVVAAVAAVVVFEAAVPAARLRHTASVVFAGETSDAFLCRTEPTYVAARWMNEHLPPTAHVLSQEQRAFYFDAPITRENIYRRRTHYDLRLDGPTQLSAKLRTAGFTHLFTADTEGSPRAAYDVTLSRLVDAAVAADTFSAPRLINEWRHDGTDGAARHYRLFALE